MSREDEIIKCLEVLSRASNNNSLAVLILCLASFVNIVLDLIFLFK